MCVRRRIGPREGRRSGRPFRDSELSIKVATAPGHTTPKLRTQKKKKRKKKEKRKKKVGLRTGKVARWSLETKTCLFRSRANQSRSPPPSRHIKEYIPSTPLPSLLLLLSIGIPTLAIPAIFCLHLLISLGPKGCVSRSNNGGAENLLCSRRGEW